MVEQNRACPDVLIQLAAIRAAIEQAAKVVLADHVESCLRGAAESGQADQEWESLKEALDRSSGSLAQTLEPQRRGGAA